jgi:type III restriction enzyme
MKFKFNENQDFQVKAIQSIVDLFEGLGNYATDWNLKDEIAPNLPSDQDLDEEWLLENLQIVQEKFNDEMESRQTPTMKIAPINSSLDLDRGQMLEGVSNDTYHFPTFSVEMETGTGKTYVYLRTILELRKHYGFSKFVIVVPSIAIYQGVIKSFDITRDHFKAIYGTEMVALRPYDSARINEVKTFATNKNVEILLITLASFNSASNNLYNATDKLPGELFPFEFIQRTRPIVIMDEPQNMNTQKSRDAIRTLKPLLSIRYSATHKETPNLTYRLTPVEAFRRNLVKKIQVIGITEQETGGKALLSLKEITGKGKSAKAVVVVNVDRNGIHRLEELSLKTTDNLFAKTNVPSHKGFIVSNIGSKKGEEFCEFENGVRLTFHGGDGVSRPDIFRFQIRETLKQHIDMQQRLQKKGIKVLSLFFVDKVLNFIGDGQSEGIIRKIFNEEFKILRENLDLFKDKSPDQVQASYFASYKKSGKTSEQVFVDGEASNEKDREAEKQQFNLIMKRKEELLSFSNPVSFIFAHSALKEGWDNPNVFQICTLNQTLSVSKKRQEIGRGLRLAVDQNGDRVFDDQVNILTVVANESYESFANTLQQEYLESEGEAPTPPKPKRAPAKRQQAIFNSADFKEFWTKLTLKSKFVINVKNDELLNLIRERLNGVSFPLPKMVITKGNFIITTYTFRIRQIENDKAVIDIIIEDTKGLKDPHTNLTIREGDDLAKGLKDQKLRGFVVHSILSKRTNPEILFSNGQRLTKFKPLQFQVEDNRDLTHKEEEGSIERFKVFNIVESISKATSLTKDTCFKIFKLVHQDQKIRVFQNPEGFTNKLIEISKNALADHIADNIEFEISSEHLDKDLEELFPESINYVQSEVVETPTHGLYDRTQRDSDIEESFILNRLERENEVILFFKFPSKYRVDFPKVIGNYNPDWAVIRKGEDGTTKLQLIRETKGTTEIEKLRFSHEIRKVKVAQRHFKALNIDYRVIDGSELNWWKEAPIPSLQLPLEEN